MNIKTYICLIVTDRWSQQGFLIIDLLTPTDLLGRRSPEFDEAEIEAALEPVLKEILGQAPFLARNPSRQTGSW